MTRTGFFAVALGALGSAAASSGPDLPPTITLEAALRLNRESSPRSLAERARAAVASADLVAARALPNPSIDYGATRLIQGESTGAVTQHQLVVQQPMLVFDQRNARKEFAQLGVGTALARADASEAARAFEIRQVFVTLLARQLKLGLLEQTRQDLERVEMVVKGRVAAGDKSRYDGMRVEIETRALRAQFANASADVEDASGRLAALLGFPGWHPRAEGELRLAAQGTSSADVLWKSALQARPSLLAAKRSEAQARGSIDLARHERLPVPALAAGTTVTREGNGASLFLGLSLPVPIFDRGQGPLARANADAHAAALELDATMAEARADLERAVTVVTKRRSAYEALQRDVMERLPVLRNMAEDAYREGQGGILELLDAFRTLKELRIANLEQLLQVELAELDALYAAGLADGK